MGAFVVVWLHMEEARSKVPVQWIRAAMAMILLLPLVTAPVGKFVGIPDGPVFIATVLVLLLRLAVGRRRAAGVRFRPRSLLFACDVPFLRSLCGCTNRLSARTCHLLM